MGATSSKEGKRGMGVTHRTRCDKADARKVERSPRNGKPNVAKMSTEGTKERREEGGKRAASAFTRRPVRRLEQKRREQHAKTGENDKREGGRKGRSETRENE